MQSGSTPQVQDYFADLKLPDTDRMELQLEQLVQQGSITPEEARTVLLESSDLNNISLDPNLKTKQMAALAGLEDIIDGGGMTAMDKANLNRIKTEANTAARGQREAILQNAQARGLGGSGLELMSQMQNQQDAATRASQRDLDVAGQAQARALEALMQQGQLAGQIQNQDFNQQAQVAQANDAISRFNAQNQQSQINQNVGARNQAQAQNLAMKQEIANANAATRNQQQQFNKGLIQQNFENEIKKRSGQAGIAQSNAQSAGQDSQSRANANNQLIGSLIGVGSALGSSYLGRSPKDAKVSGMKSGGIVFGEPTEHDSVPHMLQPGEMVIRKEDVPEMLKKAHTNDDGEFDAAGFLDSITGHKYGYSKKGKK